MFDIDFGKLRAAGDFLLPRVCAVCGRRLNLSEEHLCLHCWAELPLTHFWERTHNSMADKFNILIEAGLNSDQVPGRLYKYAYAAALFFYDGAGKFRKIPHQLKYHGNIRLGRRFGKLLGDKLKYADHFKDIDLVIPVPLHWTREWKRGYNQAEVIASSLADVLKVRMRNDILIRVRRTQTQTKIAPRHKEENVRGAFSINPSYTHEDDYHHILLVDDVFTSGSTLISCHKALRTAFPPAVRISVATLGFVGRA